MVAEVEVIKFVAAFVELRQMVTGAAGWRTPLGMSEAIGCILAATSPWYRHRRYAIGCHGVAFIRCRNIGND